MLRQLSNLSHLPHRGASFTPLAFPSLRFIDLSIQCFVSTTDQSSKSTEAFLGGDGRPTKKDQPKYTAVVRYDNNCVTIPFVGNHDEAVNLHRRMTGDTHKHHVFLMKASRDNVPIGPYRSLEEAKTVLSGGAYMQIRKEGGNKR